MGNEKTHTKVCQSSIIASLAFSEEIFGFFKALGWNTVTVDNIHESMESFHEALVFAFNETERPTFIKVMYKSIYMRCHERNLTKNERHYYLNIRLKNKPSI